MVREGLRFPAYNSSHLPGAISSALSGFLRVITLVLRHSTHYPVKILNYLERGGRVLMELGTSTFSIGYKYSVLRQMTKDDRLTILWQHFR